MKAISVMAMLVITATSLVIGQSYAKKAGRPSGNTEEAVRQLHREIVQAQLESDTVALDRLWADDHIFTNPLGVVQTKAQRLAEMKSGRRKIESFSIADVQVRVYDNTAVVTSRATLKGQRRGQDISGQYRGINVYVKNQGRWQGVAAQATRIATSQCYSSLSSGTLLVEAKP
jgi:ketosteroid isomerase-like protein